MTLVSLPLRCLLLSSVALATIASAQDAGKSPDAPASDEIVVTGQVLAEKRAVELKRKSDIVSDNLSSDETGSLPDYGLGQALKRLPGVSMVINAGRGEEQYMIIRGLAPNYNSTTLDGIQLPSTELGSTGAATSTASGRTVSYDVIPSSLAKAVNVYKSWQPDLPSDAIGGVTNIVTRSAFDNKKGPFLDLNVKGAYWEDRRRWHSNPPSGQGDVTLGTRFGANKQFGILLAGSYYRRVSSSWDTVSNGTQGFYPYTGGTQTLSPVSVTPSTDLTTLTNVPGQTGWLSYDDIRTRKSIYGKLEYRGDRTTLTISSGLARHYLYEDRNTQYLTTSGQAMLSSPSTASFAAGGAAAANHFFGLMRQLAFVQGDLTQRVGARGHVDLAVNYAHGIYNQDSVTDSYTYNAAASTLAQNVVTSTVARALSVPVNNAAFLNPANYTLAYHQFGTNHGDSKAPVIKLNLGWNDLSGDQGLGVRAGVVWRDLHQSGYTIQNRLTSPRGVTMATLGDSFYLTPYDGNGQQMLIANSATTNAYYAANASSFTPDASNLPASSIGNFKLRENTLSGYAMATFRSADVYGSLGLRLETTRQTIENYLPSSFVSSSRATSFSPNTYQTRYTRALPALNLTYSPLRDVKLRFGASETLARPDYNQLAQNSSVTVTTTATATVNGIASQSISNPNLKPRQSKNIDLSAEYYPGHDVVLAFGLFNKQISNEIVTLTNIQAGVALAGSPGVYTITTTQAQNVGKASARGLEANFVAPHFWFLPGVLSWFGFSGNLSLNDFDASSILMSDGSQRKLPSLISSGKVLYNASLLFDHAGFSTRLAYNHTGRMPFSFNTSNAGLDQYYKATDVLDLQLRYALSPKASVVFQAQNLTNNKPARLTGPFVNIYSETLENGRSFFAGFNLKFD